MNDFVGNHWFDSTHQLHIHLRLPNLRLKLNVVVTKSRLVGFQLSLGSHTSNDVADFLMTIMASERTNAVDHVIKYITLDNNPKNRSTRLIKAADEHRFGLMYITPGTPEQNMAESFFLLVKQEHAKLNGLALVNRGPDSENEAMKLVLSAMSLVAAEKFPIIQRMFIYELVQTVSLNCQVKKRFIIVNIIFMILN